MNKNLIDITVILDRSGSMQDIRKEAEGGLNAFIEKQKGEPGETMFTLVQFDNLYEMVHNGIPVKEVPHCKLLPRNKTALLDAIGRTINDVGMRLASTPEDKRPGLVQFVIVTDGEENASKEFSWTQVRNMIERQQKEYNWQFTYLGANQDAFAVGGKLGIQEDACANFAGKSSPEAFAAAGNYVSRGRLATARGQAVPSDYTAEERKSMS